MKKTILAILTVLLIFCTVSCNGEVDSLLHLRDVSLVLSSDRHASSDAEGTSNLFDTYSLVKADTTVTQPTYVILDGDLVNGSLPYHLSYVTSEIAKIFGDDVRDFYLYGSHDINCEDDFSSFLTGPYDAGNFYLYGITFCQMACKTEEDVATGDKGGEYKGKDLNNPYGNCAETAVAKFLEYANTLQDEKPMVIISHMPLHYDRKDNKGAALWVDAINEVCQKRTCIFTWGHNHTIEDPAPEKPTKENGEPKEQSLSASGDGNQTNPLENQKDNEGSKTTEQANYLKTVGQSITVQDGDSSNQVDKTISFTYVNAGYIKNGCCSLLTFTDSNDDQLYDTFTIKRYATDGNTAFGSTGYTGSYTYQFR